MPETFTRFDAADYLRTEEDVAAYLDAAAEFQDAATLAMALGTAARARGLDGGADLSGGNPSLETVLRVAGALGLDVVFRKATKCEGGSPCT